MGKKQHQKDKLYLTTTEWKNFYGGYKGKQNAGKSAEFRRLPFYCCSLSMQPFEHPLSTEEGNIFDLMNIVPFLKKYGVNPITGKKLSAKDLIKLTFHKDSRGKYHCPVTYKVFNENTVIAAVRQTGNVYANEAIEQLNIKANNWHDLITNEPFKRQDIIMIQDPSNLDKFNLSDFYHLKNNLKYGEDDEKNRKDPKYHLKTVNSETHDVLNELEKVYTGSAILAQTMAKGNKRKADRINAAHYSTSGVSSSITSTAMEPQTQQEAGIIDEDILRYERLTKKAYVRVVTNKGHLNLELHSDMVPKVCENFVKLCSRGYYNNTIFHRSIRNFMIQGGDPIGTGLGGECAWGGSFKDHFKPNLTHKGRGVLSMANSGPNSNKSQFFITFRSCQHLDGKHSVFGRVVGGLETLDEIEKVKVDKKDKPLTDITVEQCVVFVNPYEDVDEMLKNEREEARQKEITESQSRVTAKKSVDVTPIFKQGVGKYVNPQTVKVSTQESKTTDSDQPAVKKTKSSYSFGNFSSW